MSLTFQNLNWGVAPSRTLNLRVWPYGKKKAATIGRCKSISYRSQKGGEWKTYEHIFEREPLALVPYARGERYEESREIPDDMISLGWLVDIVMTDGRRVALPGYMVATDSAGSSLWLAAIGNQPRVAIEQKRRGPIVTVRGIEK